MYRIKPRSSKTYNAIVSAALTGPCDTVSGLSSSPANGYPSASALPEKPTEDATHGRVLPPRDFMWERNKVRGGRGREMGVGSGNFCAIRNAGSIQSSLLEMLRDLTCNSTIHLLMHSTHH